MKTITMKEFDLDAALNGANVITAIGNKVTSLSLYLKKQDDFCVKATDDRGVTKFYNKLGKWKINKETKYDLFMINDDMKQEIDWSEAPESCVGYSVSSCLSTYWILGNEMLMTAPDFGLTESKFTRRPDAKQVTSPIYSQEMADDGVLPAVGMEVMFKHHAWQHAKHEQAEVLAITKEHLLLQIKNQPNENHFYIKDITFKPLTPTIKLEDGKAYQFEYNGFKRLGFYRDDKKGFYPESPSSIKWYYSNCSNIKLLTVQGEK